VFLTLLGAVKVRVEPAGITTLLVLTDNSIVVPVFAAITVFAGSAPTTLDVTI